MKVDIITLQAVQNYGSVLQAFATQELLKQHGCEVTIINYIKEDGRKENLMRSWTKGNPIKALIMLPTIKRWELVFEGFRSKYLNLTDTIYTSKEDFKKYPLTADAYCTGSDQVWNSKWNRGIIPELYLDFVPENKFKFSFSASFGQSILSQEEVEQTQKYINQYNFISVRENTGKEIIEKQYKCKAIHLVDPTLGVSSQFWRQYASPRKIKEDYILIYNLNRSKEFDKYAVELANRTGLKLVRFCTRYDQFYRPGKSMLVPEVVDFISLIDNATYVLTDSFHATAFSMNMNTEPICIYPPEFGGRLESFLQLTKSTQRRVKNYNDFEVVKRRVDFNKVNKILENERNKVNEYLNCVLKEAERKQREGTLNENCM